MMRPLIEGEAFVRVVAPLGRKSTHVLLIRNNFDFSILVPNAPSVPEFAEWEEELGGLETKIRRNEDEQERMEESQEKINKELKRIASEPVELTIHSVRCGMEVSLMDLL